MDHGRKLGSMGCALGIDIVKAPCKWSVRIYAFSFVWSQLSLCNICVTSIQYKCDSIDRLKHCEN